MAEIPAPVQLKCDGCGRYYDSETDLAKLQVGATLHSLCRRCFETSTGPGDRSFDEARELYGLAPMSTAGLPPVVAPVVAARR
jgi:hypothetical protein